MSRRQEASFAYAIVPPCPPFLLRVSLMQELAADQLSPGDDAARGAAATADACETICRTLTRVLGSTGSRALLTRALTQAQAEHPALRNVAIRSGRAVALQGIASASATNGEPAVTAGLEALMGALLALLGRLIGKDMVARLVAQSATVELAEEDK
jgi:hypothetical protein